jgi:hypothetical protein
MGCSRIHTVVIRRPLCSGLTLHVQLIAYTFSVTTLSINHEESHPAINAAQTATPASVVAPRDAVPFEGKLRWSFNPGGG